MEHDATYGLLVKNGVVAASFSVWVQILKTEEMLKLKKIEKEDRIIAFINDVEALREYVEKSVKFD